MIDWNHGLLVNSVQECSLTKSFSIHLFFHEFNYLLINKSDFMIYIWKTVVLEIICYFYKIKIVINLKENNIQNNNIYPCRVSFS